LPRRYEDTGLSAVAFNLMLTVSRPVGYLSPRIDQLHLLPSKAVDPHRATVLGRVQAGEVCCSPLLPPPPAPFPPYELCVYVP
jgi:hypothetical protein